MSNPVILEIKGIAKSFGPVKALKGVDFDLRTGEVHALMATTNENILTDYLLKKHTDKEAQK